MKKNKILVLILSVLVLLDCITTYIIVFPHYYTREANTLLRNYFIQHGIIETMVLFKMLPVVLLSSIIFFIKKFKYATILFWLLLSCISVISFAVIVNSVNIMTKAI